MIHHSLLKYLSPEAQEDLMFHEKLFESEHWEYLCDLINKDVGFLKDALLTAGSWDEYLTVRGQMDAMERILLLPEWKEAEFTNIAEQEKDTRLESELDYMLDYE